jgi:hypothetical protein
VRSDLESTFRVTPTPRSQPGRGLFAEASLAHVVRIRGTARLHPLCVCCHVHASSSELPEAFELHTIGDPCPRLQARVVHHAQKSAPGAPHTTMRLSYVTSWLRDGGAAGGPSYTLGGGGGGGAPAGAVEGWFGGTSYCIWQKNAGETAVS